MLTGHTADRRVLPTIRASFDYGQFSLPIPASHNKRASAQKVNDIDGTRGWPNIPQTYPVTSSSAPHLSPKLSSALHLHLERDKKTYPMVAEAGHA